MMTKSRALLAACLMAAAALTVGCGGDMVKQLMANPEMQGKVMDAITQNSGLASQMMDKFMANDSLRTMVITKVMANGGAAQSIMAAMSKDQTMIDGVLNVAVQDPAMKEHVMTLFKGMQMAAAKH
jgi:hypothetical protein